MGRRADSGNSLPPPCVAPAAPAVVIESGRLPRAIMWIKEFYVVGFDQKVGGLRIRRRIIAVDGPAADRRTGSCWVSGGE